MAPGTEDYDYIPAKDAARMLGISPSTLSRWGDRGLIAVFVTPTKRRRFRRSDVLALLAQGRGKSPTEAAS